MTSTLRPTSFILPALIGVMGTITVASAQSASPFAKKNSRQAWEIAPAPVPSGPNAALPRNASPVSSGPLPSSPVPTSQAPVNVPRSLNNYEYRAPSSPEARPSGRHLTDTAQNPWPQQSTGPRQPNWDELKPAPIPSSAGQAQNTGQAQKAGEPQFYYPGRPNGGALTARQNSKLSIGAYESSPRSASNSAPQNSQPAFSGAQPQVQYHPDNGWGNSDYSAPAYNGPASGQWGQAQLNQGQSFQGQNFQGQNFQNQPNQWPNQAAQYQNGQYANNAPPPPAQAKRSWKERLGFDRFQTIFRGSATVGAAAVENPNGAGGWDAEFIGDADAEIEVNAITQGGLEYGAVLGARAQYDRFRRGFGQRLPDCPPSEAGCSSALINAAPTGLRGHTSQFYSDGEDDARAEEIQLETAYLFLRSAYGDVTLGRDDGAAYLFSLGAPSLLKVGASNSPVDYTGFDSVKTVNDASGFAEKVTYTSPRLLGDTVGFGVQFGASYAPNARGCGVDYCVRSNEDQGSGTVAADLRDVVEVGIALDRKFANGLKVEATGSYARADERSGFAGLDDLTAFNAGLELSYEDWVLGGSYLNSNNGLLDGDYEAYDIGLTWKPSKLGFTLGYGHATDDNVNLRSDQAVFGISYDFNKITIGGGVQYIDRRTSAFDGVNVSSQSQDATAIFIETGFKF